MTTNNKPTIQIQEPIKSLVLITPIIAAIISIGTLFWRVENLEKRIDKMADTGERLVRLETKIDLLLKSK